MKWTRRATVLSISALAACGGAEQPTAPEPEPTAVRHSGSVTDPSGDALRDSRLTVSPDLIEGRIEVVGDRVKVTARFATGTLDRLSTYVTFLLDTDQNAATGFTSADEFGAVLMGVDYLFDINFTFPNHGGSLLHCPDATIKSCRSQELAIATISDDVIESSIPLSALRGDDGKLDFKVAAMALVRSGERLTFFGALDIAPNTGIPASLVQ